MKGGQKMQESQEGRKEGKQVVCMLKGVGAAPVKTGAELNRRK